jgi:phosphoglycolate phosphatase
VASKINSPISACIIDLDGTLVRTIGDFNAAVNGMLGDLGLPQIDGQTIEPMVGRGSEHLIRSVLAHVGANQALYAQAWDSYQAHYLSINGRYSDVYPGARAGVVLLKESGLRLACLTNKPTNFAVPLLDQKGLSSYFDFVFGGDAFERKKPDPLPLIKTCEALGSSPSQTLVIGDSSNDAAAARAAGCAVVLVTYGYNHGEDVRAVDCDGFLESLAEVGDWI